MWTHFSDSHSGGYSKEDQDHIYIEAPEDEARVIFYNRFDHSPSRVTCTCCGEDYSVNEHDTLAQATGFERDCPIAVGPGDPGDKDWKYVEKGEALPEGWSLEVCTYPRARYYKTLEQYLESEDVLVIPADEIKDEERVGEVPRQGYVWMD